MKKVMCLARIEDIEGGTAAALRGAGETGAVIDSTGRWYRIIGVRIAALVGHDSRRRWCNRTPAIIGRLTDPDAG